MGANDEEQKKEEEDNVEPQLNVIESDENIAKKSNDNVGEGKGNLKIDENGMEKTEDKEEEKERWWKKRPIETKTSLLTEHRTICFCLGSAHPCTAPQGHPTLDGQVEYSW